MRPDSPRRRASDVDVVGRRGDETGSTPRSRGTKMVVLEGQCVLVAKPMRFLPFRRRNRQGVAACRPCGADFSVLSRKLNGSNGDVSPSTSTLHSSPHPLPKRRVDKQLHASRCTMTKCFAFSLSALWYKVDPHGFRAVTCRS